MRNPFKTPTVQQLIERELEESKRELLRAETLLEAWTAQRDMLIGRIARLELEAARA